MNRVDLLSNLIRIFGFNKLAVYVCQHCQAVSPLSVTLSHRESIHLLWQATARATRPHSSIKSKSPLYVCKYYIPAASTTIISIQNLKKKGDIKKQNFTKIT